MVPLQQGVSAKIIECHSERQSICSRGPRTNRSRARSVLSFVVIILIYELTYPNIGCISYLNYSIPFKTHSLYLFEALMYLFIRRTGISFTQCNTECIYFECMFDHLVNICADGLIHHDIFLILALDCLQSLIYMTGIIYNIHLLRL